LQGQCIALTLAKSSKKAALTPKNNRKCQRHSNPQAAKKATRQKAYRQRP